MLRTLRNQLVLSHLLPLLIVVPLAGLALIYFLETRVVIPQLSNELVANAQLLVEFTRKQPALWQSPAAAQQFLSQSNPNPSARAMLLSPDGRLLASSDPADAGRAGLMIPMGYLSDVQKGEQVHFLNFSLNSTTEVIDIWVPVLDNQNQTIGIVRMTYRFADIYQQFSLLRYLIAAILLFSLVIGSLLGYILALNIGSPIQQATQAINDLAYGDIQKNIPEHGPEEIRNLSRAVSFLARRLQNVESVRSQLLANMIHELGRPLGALRAGLSALLRGAGKDPQVLNEYLTGMEDETIRLQRLLDDLFQLHESILRPVELQRQWILPGEWLPRIFAPWQIVAQEKGVEYSSSIPADLPAIRIDPDRINQVLGNLVSNAIKFTPRQGSVRVSAGVKDSELCVCVSDSGPGIPPQEQEKIFEPFYRGKQGGRVPQGMGLGLGIARDLAIAHGGRLEVNSAPGRGSEFTLWLPIQNGNLS